MAFSFNRKYELFIGKPAIDKTEYLFLNPSSLADYNQFSPFEGVTLTSLQMQANIKRSSKAGSSSSDSSKIMITNMSEESRKYAEAEGASVILKAGYAETKDLPIIYSGQVISCKTTKEPSGVVTELLLGDSITPRKNARASKYYEPSVSKADIVRDLVKKLPGVGEGVYAMDRLENKYYSSGYSASGKVAEILENICKSENHEFTIENSRCYLRPVNLQKDTTDFNSLQSRSFKISSKQIKKGSGKLNNNAKDLSNQQTTKTGYLFKLFLEGRIKTAGLIEVTDGSLEGVYKVTGVSHQLDLKGTEWTTTVETEGI